MLDREFQVQLLSTAPQWLSGLGSGLNVDANGLTLFATAALNSLYTSDVTSAHLGDIVTDECGQTYWTELKDPPQGGPARWALMRHDPRSQQIELVVWLGPADELDPRKLWLSGKYLFVLDDVRRKVLALSRENHQVLFEIPGVDSGVDMDFDGASSFYVLDDSAGWRICRYSLPPKMDPQCFSLKQWQKPVALAVAPSGNLYVLDAALGRFIRFSPADSSEQILGAGADPHLLNIQPAAMDIDPRDVVFVATSAPAHLYQFAPDGSFLGEAALPPGINTISGIGFDAGGNVYLATNAGVVTYGLALAPVGQTGVYYTRTLDNGSDEGLWHRLELEAALPPKTAVEVRYVASSDARLKAAVDQALASGGSVQDEAAALEKILGPFWYKPAQTFAGAVDAGMPDLLFLGNKGRYLWIKLSLMTFDETNRPSIGKARIYWPRLSYLRYLPAAYRDNAVSAAFLERFLSLFETVFRGLENEVGAIARYFDPASAPAGFLPWLGSWVDLSIEEGLPEDRVRRLIERSPVLFKRKGTPAGLIEFLEIYTGAPVSINEYWQNFTPLVLGVGITLGAKNVIAASGTRAYRVGDSSIVGFTPLRAQDGDPSEPFQALAQRFEVVLNMDPNQFQAGAATLQRILNEQKPAHTSATIRLSASQSFIGAATLGVNAAVGSAQPYRVGYTRLGEGGAFGKTGPRVDRGAWVGNNWRLQPDR